MNERAILFLNAYVNGQKHLPKHGKTKEERIFSRWAISELLNTVWDHPWTLASDSIEAFAWKMEVYLRSSATAEQTMIFSVAADTAWEMLKLIEEVER